MDPKLQQLFEHTITNKASDLHLRVGVPPVIRVDGSLSFVTTFNALATQEVESMIFSIITDTQRELLINNRSLDFSYDYMQTSQLESKARYRINVFFQRGTLAAAFRLLPAKVKTIEELFLPKACHTLSSLKQGLVLVTGPTGHGKSTTLASMVNEINMTRTDNIITIEDPIEYVYPKGRSVISQRELGHDTYSWGESLKSLLREDPDVVLIGEMRDPESISSAITIAETGHLVFSTLHTNSASQTIDRIIDSFPPHQQNQIRIQLASTLQGIISQRLLPQIGGGRIMATEVLIATNAIQSNIREGKTHMIESIIETSQDAGMYTIESSLAQLVQQGKITREIALQYAVRPDELSRQLT
ncbi:MAG TPA: type IV pilus twitching motility protein PilT [Candidatus Levybacteria bacterium]|nr:type IV pilus twitching motility protein PilT [Candidatus Levybacteria bacterium]